MTRPTADRVRETIFNVLGQTCDDLRVLDLYAGTGALGLEAVSRGAVKAALWGKGKPPGVYNMLDVLGLSEAKA